MATLAELRAATKAGAPNLPARIVRVCLDHKVLTEIQRLEVEKQELLVDSFRASSDETATKRPRKMSEGAKPARVTEIDDQLEALLAQMRAAEGELVLQAIPGGDWQRWKDENPAREGNESDGRFTYGICSLTALIEDLGRYADQWNGEKLADSDWDSVLVDQIAPADLMDLCTKVVELHEVRVSIPKSLRPSSPTPSEEPA